MHPFFVHKLDVVGAVYENHMHTCDSEVHGDQSESGDLVLEKQLFHAHITPEHSKHDDSGAEKREPPAHEQDGFVIAERPCGRWICVERHLSACLCGWFLICVGYGIVIGTSPR